MPISIHAPRVGSDYFILRVEFIISNFNPRSPCGERLVTDFILFHVTEISIHAPRVGSDTV